MSKTPQFDAALDALFAELVPHERVCMQCASSFLIESGDIELLKKLRVPPPTLCPRCRMQRRMSYRANLKPVFYKKLCAAPGHTEQVITFYDEENQVPVCDDAYYMSDAYDGALFGQELDSSKSFFPQFHAFANKIPHQSLTKDPQSVNCEYVIGGKMSKNCYYVATPNYSEDLQYGSAPLRAKNSIEFSELEESENCYQCIRVVQSYNCSFCVDVTQCVDSVFLYDCRNCTNCFGSTNLRNKKYVFFNEQLTKEQYEKRVGEIDLGKWSVVQEYLSRFNLLMQNAVRKNLNMIKTENSTGNHLRECRNCFETFAVRAQTENVRYGTFAVDVITDSMDFFGVGKNTLVYEATGIPDVVSSKFSWLLRTAREVEYSGECSNVEYCFGCFGLKNKKYHIFNKPYSEEEYWPRVDEIKTAMLLRGEYGEFFPMKDSAFLYTDSTAFFEFPLTKDQIVSRGLRFLEEKKPEIDISKFDAIKAADLPDGSAEVTDDILKKVIVCGESGRPFRLTPFELTFYRSRRLPLPRIHPDLRLKKLLEQRTPLRLWDDHCKKCQKAMKSGFDPAKNYNVYCEECYQQEVA